MSGISVLGKLSGVQEVMDFIFQAAINRIKTGAVTAEQTGKRKCDFRKISEVCGAKTA